MLTSESVGIELRERRSEQSFTIWRPSVITSLASKVFSVCSKAFLTAQAKASKQAALLLIEIIINALQMLFCYGEFFTKAVHLKCMRSNYERKLLRLGKKERWKKTAQTSMPEPGFEPGTLRTTDECLTTAPRGPAISYARIEVNGSSFASCTWWMA